MKLWFRKKEDSEDLINFEIRKVKFTKSPSATEKNLDKKVKSAFAPLPMVSFRSACKLAAWLGLNYIIYEKS